GGRYVSGGLCLLRRDRFSGILCREPGQQSAKVSERVWRVRTELRTRQGAPFLWPRRIHLSRDAPLFARRSAIHASVSLILSGTQTRRVPAPDERARHSHV